MKKTIFVNYGVLSHEHEAIYTIAPAAHATCWDEIEVIIPAEYEPRTTASGSTVLTIDGMSYTLDEVLAKTGDEPHLAWFDGRIYHKVALPVISRPSGDK